MNESKFAPMTASLIARKGFAAPSLFAAPRPAMVWEAASPSIVGPEELVELPLPVSASELVELPRPLGVGRERAEERTADVSRAIAAVAKSTTTGEPAKPRRIMVLVTPNEIERLGIAAIKKGRTRHQIVREALDDYLVRLAREFPEPCGCMLKGSEDLTRADSTRAGQPGN